MATECYAMVRGSAIRVTGLTPFGSLPQGSAEHAVSRSVARVEINEVEEPSNNELIRNDDDDARLLFVAPGETIRHEVNVSFQRCDPGILSLMSPVKTVLGYSRTGFGYGPFSDSPFGFNGVEPDQVVGFDADTRLPTKSFALEVWSKLDRNRCEGGQQQYGYTLFPFLSGGYLSGFTFDRGLVSFNLVGAKSRKAPRWGAGPYDLEGQHQRLLDSVSRNLSFKTQLTSAPPPAQTDGIVPFTDIIDGGTAAFTTPDILDGEYVVTSPWVIDGGRAV